MLKILTDLIVIAGLTMAVFVGILLATQIVESVLGLIKALFN